jgi:hypothetical protein
MEECPDRVLFPSFSIARHEITNLGIIRDRRQGFKGNYGVPWDPWDLHDADIFTIANTPPDPSLRSRAWPNSIDLQVKEAA